MARCRALSTPSQINRQSTHGPTAPRTQPTRRRRPCKARWRHTAPQLIITTSATMTAVQWSWTARKLPTTKALTVTRPVTLTMPLSPSWLLLLLRARKQKRRLNMAISWPRRKGRPLPPLTMMARTWRTPSPPLPLPKVSKSPWISLWTAIDGTRQWTVLLYH
jgi:hypothetical protein